MVIKIKGKVLSVISVFMVGIELDRIIVVLRMFSNLF